MTNNFLIVEYAKHPEMDENVAVIVCGRETKFIRYFSNHYEDIKHCLGKLPYFVDITIHILE